MARYSGDARIVYSGNVELARQYVSEARKYLGALDENNTTNSAYRHITNSDGIRFFVANYMGQRQIEIWAPGGEEKEGAGTIQGFLLSPRTFVSPQAYSTSPHVLLEPAKSLGANWKSYFCLPNSTHPDPAYPYDVKTLNTVLVALNTNALTTNALPIRSNYSLMFWRNSKDNLYLQYDGAVSVTSPYDRGSVYHNGKLIFDSDVDNPYAASAYVSIAAVGAKRTALGLTVVIASYVSNSYAGPCFLKVHTIKLEPTAQEKARLGQYANLIDNHYSYAAEFVRIGSPTEIYSIALSKSTFYVWFCMSINGSCSELRGFIAEDPGGTEVLNEYVIDIRDFENVTHSVVRALAPVYGSWMDAYVGHIGDCPVYGEVLLADPGAQYRFRQYVQNPSATNVFDSYVRTGTTWFTGIARQFEWNAVSNIGAACAMAQYNSGAIFSTVVANGNEIFDGGF